jgi:hypothetical protein
MLKLMLNGPNDTPSDTRIIQIKYIHPADDLMLTLIKSISLSQTQLHFVNNEDEIHEDTINLYLA